MDDARLQAIEERVKAVTPGRWYAEELPPNERFHHPAHWVYAEHEDERGRSNQVVADCPWRQADAEFIAHARKDVPELVAMIRNARRWAESCGHPWMPDALEAAFRGEWLR